MKHVFLTGATGVIGSALVPLFLREPDTYITLLIRAATQNEAERRLQDLWRFWGMETEIAGYASRLAVLRGDVVLPRFALAQQDYHRLCYETTHIIHCAGNVRMTLPLQEAQENAVTPVRHVLSLAEACQRAGMLSKVDMLSTVGVGGRTVGAILEQPLPKVTHFHNTYEAAKAEAERIILSHWQGGLPITIHRPSMVVGAAESGKIVHFQVFYYLCEFLSGRHTCGILPSTDGVTIDIIPVDYVARAVHWASTHPETAGRILHLCSGPDEAISLPVLAEHVFHCLCSVGVKLPRLYTISPGLFQTLISVLACVMPRKVRRALRTLPLFLDYLKTPQTFVNTATVTLLRPAGIAVPSVKTYLTTVLDYYVQHARRGSGTSRGVSAASG